LSRVRMGIRSCRTTEARILQWVGTARKTRTKGRWTKAKGRAKEAAGSLTGNKDRKAEGQTDQDKGTLKKKKGAAKDLLS
jgi:uncharacterized protein YjbJ (UPF0337 family)